MVTRLDIIPFYCGLTTFIHRLFLSPVAFERDTVNCSPGVTFPLTTNQKLSTIPNPQYASENVPVGVSRHSSLVRLLMQWTGYKRVQAVSLLLFMLFTGSAQAQEAVCALVKIEIKQELTLERQAFDAHMRINNGLETIALKNVEINVTFADENGSSVIATSDPTNTSASFFIRVDTMDGIVAIDGTGEVAPATSADIHWLIIPAPGAAGNLPIGKLYFIGAELSYTVGGEVNNLSVTPDFITVKPTPGLVLDYFLPDDVFADDPLTPEIEPVVPFYLGVRVKNIRLGAANNLKIESAQPKIVENKQGLLIGFKLLGTSVNDQPVTNSLLADFGDIAPNSSSVARWVMQTTLSGRFIDFTAEYTHADELGGAVTSLLEGVNTHTLVHDVLVDLVGRDGVRDFLAKDGDVLRVYESSGIDTTVTVQSANSNLQLKSGSTVSYVLTTPVTAGFMYVSVPDPFSGNKIIKRAVRSDGKLILSANVWLSKRKNQNNNWQYFLNLFDTNGTDTYTIEFGDTADIPQPPVLQFIPDRATNVSTQLGFLVVASDPNGTIPVLTASPLPAGASFTDQGNGTALFNWLPGQAQTGNYAVTYVASDGVLKATRVASIVVVANGDADTDGIPDDWELKYFGNLDRDGSGDFDGDGITDLAEFENDFDPTVPTGPSAPRVKAPLYGSEVAQLQPMLELTNTVHAPAMSVNYQFEVYADAGLTQRVASAQNIPESIDTTAWTVPMALNDDTAYHWRARAYDGSLYSDWVYGEFFINTVNQAPTAPRNNWPLDQRQVDSLQPSLQVINSNDPDLDKLTYRIEVFADSALTVPIVSSPVINEGEAGMTGWTIPVDLADGSQYFWRATSTDEDGLSAMSQATSFSVNTTNSSPTAPVISSPADGVVVTSANAQLTVTNAFDADGQALTYIFEIDRVNTFTSAAKQTSGSVGEGAGSTSWTTASLLDGTDYYWRVKATDATSDSEWVQGRFTLNLGTATPPVPVVANPGAMAWVDGLQPVLRVLPNANNQIDTTRYRFEIYADVDMTQSLVEGVSNTPDWEVPVPLTDDAWIYWRVRTEMNNGVNSAWTAGQALFINDNGVDAQPLISFISPITDVILSGGVVSLQWDDVDPDSNATISLYYDTDRSGADGTLIIGNISEDPDASADRYLWDVMGVAEGQYYLYAIITDGSTSSTEYATGSIIIQLPGIDVSSTGALSTSENGSSAQLAVTLKSQPQWPVTINVQSSDESEGIVDTTQLYFNASNWDVSQTVVVYGVDDRVDDGDVLYTVSFNTTASIDPDYYGLPPVDIALTNVDDDSSGVTVTPNGGLVTTEAGAASAFTVVLTSEPTAAVTITLNSSDITEGVINTSSLGFDASNWQVPQTVTVISVNDNVDDGDQTYSIALDLSSSNDPVYKVLPSLGVTAINQDDDVSRVIVTPDSGLLTTEMGGSANFTVVLASEPTAPVTITLTSSDTTEGIVIPSINFSAANWSIPQTLIVTGVNDDVDDGDQAYSINLDMTSSSDTIYKTLPPLSVAVANQNDDVSGVSVTPASGLVTTELGGSTSFTVVLTSEPIAPVIIALTTNDSTEGSISASQLGFDASNWKTPQTVTVTGINDDVDDGDQAYSIGLDPGSSTDTNYKALTPLSVAITNQDDDVSGVTVAPNSGLLTTEAGGTATFTVVLTSEPIAAVVIDLASSDSTEGLTSTPQLVFDAANWKIPQTVTISGVNDDVDDSDQAYSISLNLNNSSDPNYKTLSPQSVAVTNQDDDVSGVTVTPNRGLSTTEAGGTATFTVVLTSEPTAPVVINMASSDATEGSISTSQLGFNASNWKLPQTVTLTGVNDDVEDGDQSYSVSLNMNTSSDLIYRALSVLSVTATNLDDDESGVTVTPVTGLITTEAGGTASFAVVLTSEPVAPVTLAIISSDTTEGIVDQPQLVFNASNWKLPQSVIITGVNDDVDDGDQVYTIALNSGTSSDPIYRALPPISLAVSNQDDDVSGVSVTPENGLITTEKGGTASFTVVLTSEPTAAVSVALTSSDSTEGWASASQLGFDASNWMLPQTVTLTGVDDDVDDGDQVYTIELDFAASSDLIYSVLPARSVAVSNEDDDVSGVTITPGNGLVTTEAGGTDSFTVVLTSEPTAAVTIALSSSDPSEGTIDLPQIDFTAGNWKIPQTVTVTGEDDKAQDEDVEYSIDLSFVDSADALYALLATKSVSVINEDDDIPEGPSWMIEVGTATLPANNTVPAMITVSFRKPFLSPPLVFLLADSAGVQPADARIISVTTTGFQVAQVMPAGSLIANGPMTINFLALDEGVHQLPDGTRLEARTLLTINTVQGKFSIPEADKDDDDKGDKNKGDEDKKDKTNDTSDEDENEDDDKKWIRVNFINAFYKKPMVLAQIQSLSNEIAAPAYGTSVPWLTAAVDEIEKRYVELALERSEVAPGNVLQLETLAYLAIEANISGNLTDALGESVSYETLSVEEKYRGWDQGCGAVVNRQVYSALPVMLASKQSRESNDGGWFRQCVSETGWLGLTTDEDQYRDAERKHPKEDAGIFIFSKPFDVILAETPK